MKYYPLLLLIFTLFACKTKQNINESTSNQKTINFSPTQELVLLDSAQAASTILVDKMDYFFEKITIADMTVQLKKVYDEKVSRKEVLKDYKNFLQDDVSSFTASDITFLESIFKEVFDISEQLGDDIFPSQVQLIKMKGKHYGPSVYYTRENVILIPEDVLQEPNYQGFLEVMFHELFHIYSRLESEKRAALYELIGFQDIGDTRNLVMKPDLAERVLLNPDGVNYGQKIILATGDTTLQAVPIITSTERRFIPTKTSFFNYLNFQLYEIKTLDNGKYEVISKEEGTSTLDLAKLPDFFKQIKDNTQYIIHPDEILADNFVILAMWQKNVNHLEKYSEGGQSLVKAMKAIIEQ